MINKVFFLKGYALVEFWFGFQATGTSLLSIGTSDPTIRASIMLIIVAIVGQIQCHFAINGNVRMRHYTNLASILFTAILVSNFIYEGIVNDGHYDIATWGYSFILFPTAFAARHTHLVIHHTGRNSG